MLGGQADGIDEVQFPADQNAGFQNGGSTVGQDLPTENITPVGIPGEGTSAHDQGVDRTRGGGGRLVLISRVAIGWGNIVLARGVAVCGAGLGGIVFGLGGVRVTRGNGIVGGIVEHLDGKLLLQRVVMVVGHLHPYAEGGVGFVVERSRWSVRVPLASMEKSELCWEPLPSAKA